MTNPEDPVKPRRVVSTRDAREGDQETEITAQLTIPQDGGWGWAVVIASFINIFILDGITYTFGAIHSDIAIDLGTPGSLVAMINSIGIAIYFIASPLASALINKFGFRECAMTGSVICSVSLLISYFCNDFITICTFYGGIAGFGFSLINMSSGLVVGFYFEKLRSIALAVATCGSSAGVTAMYPLNAYLVKIAGWRTTTLLHSGLLGLVYFFSMSFRPLLSVTIAKVEPGDTRVITYLPSVVSIKGSSPSRAKSKTDPFASSGVERLFSAVSSMNYPTAAKLVRDVPSSEHPQVAEAGPSTSTAPPPAQFAVTPLGQNITADQLKKVQSFVMNPSQTVILNVGRPKKRKWWERLCHWESHVRESRPMYRDDAFYGGKYSDLAEYKKSSTGTDTKGGLDYHLSVTRTVAVGDLQETRHLFSTAVRRVLATMMDHRLLKRISFLLLCLSGFLTYLGLLIPYVYLRDRNKEAGVDPNHLNYFISAIGLANAIGRLSLGALATKIDPLKIFAITCSVAGVSTMVSGLSYNIYYQYSYCFVFGFCVASIPSMRSIIIVSLYGLDKLTNATGMLLIFLGLGNLVSTPVAGILASKYGYTVAFCAAGLCIMLSGLIVIPVQVLANKESKVMTDGATVVKK